MTIENINIAAAFCSTIMMLLLFFGSLSMNKRKEKVYTYFFYLLLANLIATLLDLFVGFVRYYAEPGAFNLLLQIVEHLNFANIGFQIIFFSLYLMEFLSTKTIVNKKPFYAVVVIGVLSFVLLIISVFNNMYFTIDEQNNYIWSDTAWISQIPSSLTMLIFSITIIKYKSKMSIKEFLSVFSMVAAPLLVNLAVMLIDAELYLDCLVSSIVIFAIYVNIQTELRRELEVKQKNADISVMLSQIKPHFLFNSLTSISRLYSDNPEAKEAVICFADYLRNNMDSLNQKQLIPFRKELEHVNQYLYLEKLRFKDKLEIIMEIDTDEFMLPSLTLQPIVENAVYHGITKKENGGTLKIQVKESEKSHKIYVIDNGVGFNENEILKDGRSHIGISNVKARLEALCGGRLYINSVVGEGTEAILEIPKGVSDAKNYSC